MSHEGMSPQGSLKLNTKSIRADQRLSKAVRAAVGMNGKPYPIVDVNGLAPPTVWGRDNSPRIVVGRGWLIQQGLI